MGRMVEVETKGFEEAAKLLRMLPPVISTNVLQGAQRTILKGPLQDMKNLAKLRTSPQSGRYQKSIGYKSLRKSQYTVASLIGYRFGLLGAPHAELLEGGTAERYLKKPRLVTFQTKSGEKVSAVIKRTGRGPATNVMKDSIAMNRQYVETQFETYILKSLEKTMKRYEKRYGR